MKALSIRHPHVTAILAGRRPLEVRAHATRHRGDLLLHAAAAFGGREQEELARIRALGVAVDAPEPGERGALVGLAQLVDCHPMSGPDWDRALLEPRDGEWWAWELAGIERFPDPIPYRGRLFMWEVPDTEFEEALARATA